MGILTGIAQKLFSDTIHREVMKAMEDKRKYEGEDVYGAILKMMGGNAAYMPDNIESYINNGYLFNPITYSIVSYIAQKASNLPFSVYQIKDEKALQLYKSAGPAPSIPKMRLYKKALEEIKDHELQELFVRPNALQGWAEFIEQAIGFKLVTGNTFIHAIGPTSGVNAGKIQEMWILPTQLMEIIPGNQIEPIKGYRMKTNREVFVPANEVIHLKYWTPEYASGAFLWGLSPIRAARRVVTRSNASYDSSVAAFQNMGAMGFVSTEGGANDPGLTPEQAKDIQERLSEKSGPKNRGKYMVSGVPLRWQQMGMSPVDLAILESDKIDLRMQCNIFHVPSELFGDAENKTYANTKEAGRAVYTNAVLPALNQFRDAVNKHLSSAIGERTYIDYDATMLPEMQDDINAMVTSLQGAWWLTGNERRELMVWPKDENEPLMDNYLIPMGLVPLTGYMPSEDDIKALELKYGY